MIKLCTNFYVILILNDEFYTEGYRFHAKGEKSISIGNSSSLPASISKQRTTLDNHERSPKCPAGPTAPNPGPTLLIHAATAVKAVEKST